MTFKADSLSIFASSLSSIDAGPDVTNPYANPRLKHNLERYLDAVAMRPGDRLLLVGEALGYRGGLHTGIPFTSARLLRTAPHRFLQALKPTLDLRGNETEATAASLWQFLARRTRIPLCWNAFPFHPHKRGNPTSNRAPNSRELAVGRELLTLLIESYHPNHIIAVGNAAYRAVGSLPTNARVSRVRHPSYGGKSEFMVGMARAYRQ